MAAPNEPAGTADKWQSFGHARIDADAAVECGWSRDGAAQTLAAAFPGQETLTAAEARAALEAARGNGGPPAATRGDATPPAPEPGQLAARLVEDVLDYRIERAQVAARYQAIRHAKVNLKRLLKSADVNVDQLRVLGTELGWAVREDEEGVTVPVNDLIPFFRRPVVRQLLDAKMKQCGLAPA